MKVDNGWVSSTDWGDVDKSALGRALAEAYAAGEASKAVIREAYAFVPEDAFGEDAEGKPAFKFSMGWGPHHELDGETLIVNRGGVIGAAQALAGARAEPSLSRAELATANRHIRKHYRELEMEAPESLAEEKRGREAEGNHRRFIERIGSVSLLEAAEGQPRRVKAIGITAGVVNGNGRRYPADVLRAAVEELQTHLHESAGQGWLVTRAAQLLGEAEHPSDKAGRPSLLETVVRWENVDFDGAHVLLEGSILPTSKGKDILA